MVCAISCSGAGADGDCFFQDKIDSNAMPKTHNKCVYVNQKHSPRDEEKKENFCNMLLA